MSSGEGKIVDVTVEQAVMMCIRQHKEGDLKAAEANLRNILDNFGTNVFEAQLSLGNVCSDQGNYYEALYRFDRALALRKRAPLAIANRGMILGELGHHDEALAECYRAAHLDPKNHVIWNNIGNTLIFLHRYTDAIEALRKALSINPMHLLSHYNLGVAYLRNGEHKAGIFELDRALQISPDYPEARFNLGLAQLCLGDFENGFKNYESRWLTAEYAGYHKRFPQTKWNDEPLEGKSIIVYGDQGLGDSIMFCRYLPHFLATGAKVYGVAHKPLHDLFVATFPEVEWLPHGGEMPKIDYRCSFPSAPHAFWTTPTTVPLPIPFEIDDGLIREIGETYMRPGLNIGVVWSGNWKHENDKSRSIPLATFRQLFNRMDGVNFHSLQYEVRPVDQPIFDECHLLVPQIRNYADTCAIVSNLDLVITVDTSVAHVAGTMGVPTWVLIPTPRVDWRWLTSGEDSAWYPSVKLYRQTKEGDWDSVLRRVKGDLRALAPAREAA